MKIIEIEPLPNGAHRNTEMFSGTIPALPEGWAIVPDKMKCENYPFGEIEVEKVDGLMTVTKWIPGVMPEVKEVTL